MFLCFSFSSRPYEKFAQNPSFLRLWESKSRNHESAFYLEPWTAGRITGNPSNTWSNTFMWNDTTTVLQWLNSGSKQPTFEANRIGEILESTAVDRWFQVLICDNTADTGIRGI